MERSDQSSDVGDTCYSTSQVPHALLPLPLHMVMTHHSFEGSRAVGVDPGGSSGIPGKRRRETSGLNPTSADTFAMPDATSTPDFLLRTRTCTICMHVMHSADVRVWAWGCSHKDVAAFGGDTRGRERRLLRHM